MSTSDTICTDCKDSDDVCDVIGKLSNMNTEDKDDVVVSVCANCGKEGSDITNICNKCKQVKYCNAVCKKVHKKKHKKECEEHVRLAAEKHNDELRRIAELHDEKLFKQPPIPLEDCPLCFLRLPTLRTGRRYYSCCGKMICSGCIHAPLYDNQGNKVENEKCPFCRAPHPTGKEIMKRLNKRVDANDAHAMCNMGVYYRDGIYGHQQDHAKALELWHRAAELGFAGAYSNIGIAYDKGEGVEVDKKKANHYYELAAIGGSVSARDNLGSYELEVDNNMDRALKHYLIAARNGEGESLERIKLMYTHGHATKDVYMKALQAYQVYLGEIKSEQRDNAAADREDYRYY